MHTDWYPYRSHAVIQGTTQQGKSKFAEHCAREHIRAQMGFCFIDWHGSAYHSLLKFIKYIKPRRRVILADLSAPDHIVPWNFVALPKGHEPSAHVGRLVSTFVKAWGAKNANDIPTFERVAKMLLHYCAISGEPLQHAAKLLRYPNKHLRRRAIDDLPHGDIRDDWEDLHGISSRREWNGETLSTVNRISRFLSSKSIQRIIGLKGASLDISKAINDKAIILVNLKRSAYLDSEAARLFATLLLDEFLNVAVQNTDRRRPYWLCCDESQEYLTDDAASMLDQAMKSGLRLSLIHHNDSQFEDRPKVLGAMKMTARIKCVFAGLPFVDAAKCVPEFYLPEVNQTKEKRVIHNHQTTGHKLTEIVAHNDGVTDSKVAGTSASETDTVTSDRSLSKAKSGGIQHTQSDGDSVSEIMGYAYNSGTGFAESEGWAIGEATREGKGKSKQLGSSFQNGSAVTRGKTVSNRLDPIIERLVSGVQDFTNEEKISMIAERFTSLKPLEYILRLPDGTHTMTVPTLEDYLLSPARTVEFEKSLLAGTIPASVVDQTIIDQKNAFLEGTIHDTDTRDRTRKNRPLSPQN